MGETTRSVGIRTSWINWRVVGAGLVVLSGFSTWAVARGMPLPSSAQAATELAASAANASIRSDHDTVTPGTFGCVDPGHCGGIIDSSGEGVPDGDIAATTFAFSWARDWNRWAEGHVVPQQILTIGCRYLSTEQYYLCAVRVSLDLPRVSADPPSTPGTSCGLIVVSAQMQAAPDDRIVNGLKTSCHIFSTYPRQVVSPRRPASPEWLELAPLGTEDTRP